MSDLTTERLITIPQAAAAVTELLPGWPCCPTTIWRWVNHGVRRDGVRVKLESIRIGARHATSREAVIRFLGATSGQAPAPAKPKRREAARAH